MERSIIPARSLNCASEEKGFLVVSCKPYIPRVERAVLYSRLDPHCIESLHERDGRAVGEGSESITNHGVSLRESKLGGERENLSIAGGSYTRQILPT